jgi:nitroimidazol reductase NimA-like FMN-containing flavoprotein (pyridoxamine 5'-phosphate oxidase superfamily)
MGTVSGPARATGKGGTKEHDMPDREPIAEPMLESDDATAMPWAEATRRLTEEGRTGTFWLATARSDGRPHVAPVWAVWHDGALYFATGQGTRKGRNLARNPRCVVTLSGGGLDLVIEGSAARLTDEARLRRVAAVYAAKGWPVTVRDGAFQDTEGAPTAGPPPYDVYVVTPTVAFGFGTGAENWDHPTRWRFVQA